MKTISSVAIGLLLLAQANPSSQTQTRAASPLDLARTLGKLLGVEAGGTLSNDLDCARAK